MPTFEISKSDLEKLTKKKFTIKELEEEALLYAKSELEDQQGDTLKIDVKDTNRPDLWSVEGIARVLRGNYRIEEGLLKYNVKKSGLKVIVDSKTKSVRPRVAGAIVRGLKIDNNVLSQMIQLQEKVAGTLGRGRKEVSIGVYDLSKIKFPVHFKLVDKKTKFTPLDFPREMAIEDILKNHPKGKQYSHLLEGAKQCPVLIDSQGEILSLAPIINSNHTGRVTEDVKDVFIDCTGFNDKYLMLAMNVVTTALAERGGKIESIDVVYTNEIKTFPNLNPKKAFLEPEYCRKILGLNITNTEMVKLLKKSRYNAKLDKKTIHVEYPAYRSDIMHQRDLVEDVAIAFGYNNIESQMPSIPTTGSRNKLEEFTNTLREVCVGLGLQEILTFTLTSKENMFKKMNIPEEKIVEIENPVSSNWSVFRDKILPNILEFLAYNKNQDYPQKVFEIGDVVIIDPKNKETGVSNKRRLSVTLTNTEIGYEDASSLLNTLLSSLGRKLELKKANHDSFIPGRVAEVYVDTKLIGLIGEMHPKLLNMWNLEKPVVAFELNVEALM